MAQLKTDYLDYVAPAGGKKYQIEQNQDSTYSITDVTEYDVTGDTFGAAALNAITTEVNTKAARLQFTDTPVDVTAFVADETYEDFPYRAAIALTGVLATMTPEVVLGVAEAMSGNYAPVAVCYAGGVYLYAAEVPEAAITIPTIICWKAVE